VDEAVDEAVDEVALAEVLSAFVASRLAKYKVPRKFIFVESLPRTPYGKVVKGDLRSLYLSKKSSSSSSSNDPR
jgi:acyl-coenzyme A synthetase/AMP-(fatty) acid ligase